MRSSLTGVVFFLFSIPLFGQGDFRDGYVILANGDSVVGQVAYRHSLKNATSCNFRSSSSREVIRYSPHDLQAYGYFDDKRFESKTIPDSTVSSPVFVEVILKGHMSLLKRHHTLYVELHDGKIIELPVPEKKIVDKTTSGVYSDRTVRYTALDSRYVAILNTLITDCGLKADGVKYDQVPVGHIIQNYNRCHYGAGIYYKETKKNLLLTYQAFAGIQASRLVREFDKKKMTQNLAPSGGVSVDFSSPKMFDRVFLSMEAVYSREFFQYYDTYDAGSGVTEHYDITLDQSYIKIPISLRYNFFNEYRTVYAKLGVFFSFRLKNTVGQIKETETSVMVKTWDIEDEQVKGRPIGYFGSVGFTHGISRNLKGFLELRFESLKAYEVPYAFKPYFYNNSIYIFAGLRF